jgi:hypothetical protein
MRLNGHRDEAFTYEECLALMDEAGVDRLQGGAVPAAAARR